MSNDPKLISFKQYWEIQYIHFRYGIPKDVIRQVMLQVGKGRKKVYEALRQAGYPI